MNIHNELLSLVLQDFPESMVVTLVVFSFLCLPLQWKRVLAVALLQTVTNLVRLLPVAFGVHTVLLVISLSLYVRIITGTRLSRVLLASLSCVAILVFIELIYTKPLLELTNLDYATVFHTPVLRALFSLPYEVVLLIIALAKNYYNHRKGKFSQSF